MSPSNRGRAVPEDHRPSSRKPYGSSSSSTSTSRNVPGHGSSSGGKITTSSVKPSSPDLPRSVRNASPDMRSAIRRQQNNESSRRSRARKRQEDEQIRVQVKIGEGRIKELEKQVSDLESTLQVKRTTKAKITGSKHVKRSGGRKTVASPGEYFEPDQKFFGDAF